MGGVIFAFLATFAPTQAQSPALLLFGDEDHTTFLGCLNCSKFDGNSICNQFGEYGSKYSISSIWNEFGTFGSMFSIQSPWNQFSTFGPVIVDYSGQFYGRFTSNRVAGGRTRIQALNELADAVAGGVDLDKARQSFCGE
jgi:hypothetical protein